MTITAGRPRAVALGLLVFLAACSSSPSATASPSLDPSASAAASPSRSLEPTPTASPQPSASDPLPASASPTTMTVRQGDTLSSIARTWGTTVLQLVTWNAERYPSLLDDPNTLQAGWVLIVAGDPDATPVATPTHAPTPTPPPVATGCSAGNRVPAGGIQTFTTVPGAGHAVGLTLDMGGRLDPGVDILNFLIANEVCVTIFPTGAMTQTAEGQRIMAIIRAHPELFEVGNHTMYHCDLVRGGGGSPTLAPCAGVTPTADFIQNELTTAAAIIAQYSGQNPQPYWRPPYGSVNDAVRSAAAAAGYTKTFMWDIDTIDWKPISQGGPTADGIATKVITNAQDGSIVLMHLGGYETLDALKKMVPGLRDRGFLLTSLSDLLS
jgi:peptidoglycan/xylan/chitin deacetylase (PgdA/CDA1 family)/LysM repeat protein